MWCGTLGQTDDDGVHLQWPGALISYLIDLLGMVRTPTGWAGGAQRGARDGASMRCRGDAVVAVATARTHHVQ